MQIPPTAALLNVLSSLPAQAGQVVPAGSPGNPSPTQAAGRAKPVPVPAEVPGAARSVATAASQPSPADSVATRNLPRGSIINIVV